ncbi:hypothetical protein Bca4012_046980 [Brassica carinata]
MAARQQPRGTGLGVQHEDFVPKSEWKDQPEATLLTIDLPDFTKEQIKTTYLQTSKMLRVTGERPLAGRRWSRFNEVFSVPHNCLVDKIHGNFNNNSLTITMPKEITKMSNLPETSKNMAEKFEKLEEKRLLEQSIRKAKEKEVEKKKKLLEEREAILRKLQEEAKTKEMAERRKLQEEAKAKDRAEAKRLQEEAIAKEKAEARKLQEKAKAKELFPLTATRHQPRGTGLGVQYEDFVPNSGWKDQPEATLLTINLPVTGERPLAGRRWSRFNEVFSVPHNCLVDKIHGNFNNNSLTITMPKEITKMSNLPETSKNMAEKFEKLEEKRLLEQSIRKAKEKEVEKKKKLLEEREAILRKLQEEAKTKEMAERRKLQEEAKAKERAEAKRLQEEAIAKEKAEARKLQEKAKAKELFPLTATRHQPRGTGLGVQYEDFVPNSGWKDQPEATLLTINLPGWYTK